MTFLELVFHNLGTRRTRTALTTAAVALAVMTVVTLGVVTTSLRSSAAAVLEMGRADFSIAQKGASDIVNSVMTETQVDRIGKTPGVAGVTGVLVSLVKLDANNPVFLEIGLAPDALAPFGVHVVAGHAYAAHSPNDIMLGWQAAENLGKKVGDTVVIGGTKEHVVGLFSTGQSFGDSGAMFPLVTLQGMERKPGLMTLGFVRVERGWSVAKVRAEIDAANPNLATVSTIAQFGRVDRNLAFLSAVRSGAEIVALFIGVLIVLNTMLLSFIERIREFGLLRAIGWSRGRLLSLVVGEALVMSVMGGIAGSALSVAFSYLLEEVPSLRGIFHASLSAGDFVTALYTAISIGAIAALYPALRAARLRPLAALRRE